MKNWFKSIAVAAALVSSATFTQAQDADGRREEFRQRMSERLREQFGVTDDAEWKVIEGKIQKVNDARRAVGGGGFGGMAFGRRGGPGGPGGGDGERAERGDRGNRGERAERGGRGGRFGGFEPSPEAEALRKAIEAKAPADEIKAKLAKVREVRKENEAKLEAAQEDLRKVLTVRQEAIAFTMGLVK